MCAVLHSTRPLQCRSAADVAFFEGDLPSSYHLPAGHPERECLLPSRNNSHAVQVEGRERPAFRFPRAYVQACCKATLGLVYESGRVVLRALACGSWSCPHCRRQLAARLLDRARAGMGSRVGWFRSLITLTVDPARYGGVFNGYRYAEDGRRVRCYAPPGEVQYRAVMADMSRHWNRLNQRLRMFFARRGLPGYEYLRVIELHRSGWPHYHVVAEHPDMYVPRQQVEGWELGLVHIAEGISLDDAAGEIMPYLFNHESRAGKTYQFAAAALPEGFRLWSASRGFLGELVEAETEGVEAGLVLRGHFTSYRAMFEQDLAALQNGFPGPEWVDGCLVLPSSTANTSYVVSPGGSVSGVQLRHDYALPWFANLISAESLVAPPSWFVGGVSLGEAREVMRQVLNRRVFCT